MPVILVFITALAIAGQTQPTLKPELTALTFFQGAWSCDGKFSKDNRKISSDMAFQPDLEGAWLMVRHDDRPPNTFHAVEFWGFDKTAGQFCCCGERQLWRDADFYFSRLAGKSLDMDWRYSCTGETEAALSVR